LTQHPHSHIIIGVWLIKKKGNLDGLKKAEKITKRLVNWMKVLRPFLNPIRIKIVLIRSFSENFNKMAINIKPCRYFYIIE